MKRNSSQQSWLFACCVLLLDMTLVLSELVWAPHLTLSSVSKLHMIHSLWLSPSHLAASRMVLAALHWWLFISTRPSVGHLIMKSPKLLPPLASVCSSAFSLSLATDPSISERASGELGMMGPLGLPLKEPFRLQGRWWVCTLLFVPCFLVCSRLFPVVNISEELAVYFMWGANVYKSVSSFLFGADGSPVKKPRFPKVGLLFQPLCPSLRLPGFPLEHFDEGL